MSNSEMKPVYGDTNPGPEDGASQTIRRYGSVIGLKPDCERHYRELHANAWPAVIARLKQSNVQNYSIYVTELDGKHYLFSYFEYTGDDYAADMQAIAEDPETRRWWQQTDPLQIQLPNRKNGDNWSMMERVFLMP
jgi:L-rhamnose mutarotase